MKTFIKYGLMHGGLYNGIPVLVIGPGKTDHDEESLYLTLTEQFEKMNMILKLVIVETVESIFSPEEEVELLKVLRGLKDDGCSILMYTNATHRPLYGVLDPYTVVVIEDGQEPFVKANEIRWIPEGDWDEPPLLKYKAAGKYLIPGKKGLRGAHDFLKNCEQLWGVILPVKSFMFVIEE